MVYSLPFIAALIGWFTNYIAVKMLFHPQKPVKILFFTIQGVFPKRQQQLGERIGKLVSNELFSVEDIKKVVKRPENLDEMYVILDQKADVLIREKLVASMPMLAMFINDALVNKVKEVLVEEFKKILPELIDKYADKLDQSLKIDEVVADRVKQFSMDKLESVLYGILSKEFAFIEIVGAVLGFLIGVVQLLLAMY